MRSVLKKIKLIYSENVRGGTGLRFLAGELRIFTYKTENNLRHFIAWVECQFTVDFIVDV